MRPRYELHISGKVIPSFNVEELRNIAKSKNEHWELFVFYESSMKMSSNEKMNIRDIREAARMQERGIGAAIIANKYKVNRSYLLDLLRKNKNV